MSHLPHTCHALSPAYGWGLLAVCGVVMPRDPFDYMTAATAAEHFGVSEACIRKWVQRDGLEPVGRGPRGQMLFRWTDIARVEGSKARRAGRLAAALCGGSGMCWRS